MEPERCKKVDEGVGVLFCLIGGFGKDDEVVHVDGQSDSFPAGRLQYHSDQLAEHARAVVPPEGQHLPHVVLRVVDEAEILCHGGVQADVVEARLEVHGCHVVSGADELLNCRNGFHLERLAGCVGVDPSHVVDQSERVGAFGDGA